MAGSAVITVSVTQLTAGCDSSVRTAANTREQQGRKSIWFFLILIHKSANVTIKYTLAGDVSCLFIYDTRGSSAAKTSVRLAFRPLVAGGTHTLHMSRARQRAAFGVYAIMVTNICDQTERKPIIMTNLKQCMLTSCHILTLQEVLTATKLLCKLMTRFKCST